MIRVWVFAIRVAVAASYFTLAITDNSTASSLAGPYAFVVFAIAVSDLIRTRRARNDRGHTD